MVAGRFEAVTQVLRLKMLCTGWKGSNLLLQLFRCVYEVPLYLVFYFLNHKIQDGYTKFLPT